MKVNNELETKSLKMELGFIMNLKDGYGFIEYGNPNLLFFHFADLVDDPTTLEEYDKVKFTFGNNDRGLCARNIKLLHSKKPSKSKINNSIKDFISIINEVRKYDEINEQSYKQLESICNNLSKDLFYNWKTIDDLTVISTKKHPSYSSTYIVVQYSDGFTCSVSYHKDKGVPLDDLLATKYTLYKNDEISS